MTTPKISAMISAGSQMQTPQANGIDEMKEGMENSFLNVMKTVQNGANAANTGNPDAGVPAPAKKAEPRVQKADGQQTDTTVKPDRNEQKQSDDAKVESKDATAVREDNSNTVTDETKVKITEAAGKVKEAIAKELDVAVEDIEAAMEILGLTATDLLNPQIVPNLVAEVTGNDISAVLTDETLYSTVNEIQGDVRDVTSQLLQDLDMTQEEFIDTMNTLKQEIPAEIRTAVSETAEEPETENTEQGPTETRPEGGFEKEIRVQVENSERDTVRTPAEANPERKTEADVTERKSAPQELSTEDRTEVTETEDRSRESGQQQSGRHHSDNTPNQQNTSFVQNLTQTISQNIENAGQTAGQTASYVDAQRLLEQIDSQIRVNFVNREETAMQMELNPASLGRLNVQLISRNGEITAQFEAQNAQVRAALEGHVAQLKESLEAQGIKIESVEVTVASHAFEQNLMQGQDGGQQQAGNAQGGGGRMRRINLNDEEIEGVEGAPQEEEAVRIAKSMMAANGGSVDFQA